MNAKYEKRVFSGNEHVWAGKYFNLHNVPHWHGEDEIILCLEGSAVVTISDTGYEIHPGEGAFCASGIVHSIQSKNDSVLYVCIFNDHAAQGITDQYKMVSPTFHYDRGMMEILEEINLELKQKEPLYAEKTEMLVRMMLIEVFRAQRLIGKKDEMDVLSRFKELLSAIDETYYDFTFDKAVKYMNFSPPYFSKYFKEHAGCSFSQYMNLVKVEKAVIMVNDGCGSLKDLMARCGFGSLRSLNRVFKDVTGYTPTTLPKGYVLSSHPADEFLRTFDPTVIPSVLLGQED